ncbi:transcription factor [Artemisia annua]|uniref:Transcription factor n=1 Tax=Artemisia annua TaxID=35608 RepID=A0A2U1NUU8_ARTAN|nr:transcription factor [Artemisia annua]
MESCNGKIWVHFTVDLCPECLSTIKYTDFKNSDNFFEQANKDVTRMEIFISLISLLDPAAKNVASSAACNANVNISVHKNWFISSRM